MDTMARWDLTVRRNDDTWAVPLQVVGLDLTGVAVHAQIRLAGDTPGAPLIDLPGIALGGSAVATGVRLVGVTTTDGIPTSTLSIQLAQVDRQDRTKLPYFGELGDTTVLAWGFQIAGITRLQGQVFVPPAVMGSDNAPPDRPPAYGAAMVGAGGASGGVLMIAADGGATLTIDGAGEAAIAIAAAAQAQAAARFPGFYTVTGAPDLTAAPAPAASDGMHAYAFQAPAGLIGPLRSIDIVMVVAGGLTVTVCSFGANGFTPVAAGTVTAPVGRSNIDLTALNLATTDPGQYIFVNGVNGGVPAVTASGSLYYTNAPLVAGPNGGNAITGSSPLFTVLIGAVPFASSAETAALRSRAAPPTPRSLRSRVAKVTQTLGSWIGMGDSIKAGPFYASSPATHDLELVMAAMIGDVDPNSRVGLANFADAAFHGITLSGSWQIVNVPPLGQALQLNVGGAMAFSGNFANLVLTATQASAGGVLTTSRGGTIDTWNVPVGLDVPRQIATGSTGQDSYTVTGSGAPVIITSLHRLGARAAGVRAPFFQRIARQGQPTTNFATDAWLSSAIRQAQALTPAGSIPLFDIEDGANNVINGAVNTTPAQMQADLERRFALLLSSGAYVIKQGMIRPDPARWPVKTAGYVFDDFLAAEVAACERYGVPYLSLDAVDFVGLGLTSTGDGQGGLHPGDAGYAMIAQLKTAFILGGDFARIAAQPARRGRISIVGPGAPTIAAMDGSRWTRTDGAAGSREYLNTSGQDLFGTSWLAVA